MFIKRVLYANINVFYKQFLPKLEEEIRIFTIAALYKLSQSVTKQTLTRLLTCWLGNGNLFMESWPLIMQHTHRKYTTHVTFRHTREEMTIRINNKQLKANNVKICDGQKLLMKKS